MQWSRTILLLWSFLKQLVSNVQITDISSVLIHLMFMCCSHLCVCAFVVCVCVHACVCVCVHGVFDRAREEEGVALSVSRNS